MRNLKITLMFDGSSYHGWQKQKNAITVSQTVSDAIFRLTGETPKLFGCSRTDAGVHALAYIANFHTSSRITAGKIPYALNFILPPDIRVTECEEAADDFHAQYSCVGKEYIYFTHYSHFDNPFYMNKVYHYKYGAMDEKRLNCAAKQFIGAHDFSAFMAQGSPVKSTVRTVKYFEVDKAGDFVRFKVYADGFLYNMVRIMVGTLLDINRGRIGYESIGEIIMSRDRTRAGTTAPPWGLYLSRVDY